METERRTVIALNAARIEMTPCDTTNWRLYTGISGVDGKLHQRANLDSVGPRGSWHGGCIVIRNA